MKTYLYLSMTALIVGFQARAQIVNIPDPYFKLGLVQSGIDLNNNGEIEVSEAEAATSINIGHGTLGVRDLTGVDAFINVTSIDLEGSSLTTIDISKLTKLQDLDVRDNSLRSLDLSHNPLLTWIDANGNRLSSIDLNHNPNLSYADFGGNRIGSIKIDSATALVWFDLSSSSISSLDLRKNTHLYQVAFYDSPNLTQICILPSQFFLSQRGYADPGVIWNTNCDNLPTVNIPDPNFKAALIASGVDTDHDELILVSEAEAVTSLTVSNQNIADLTGIESFTHLTYLDCSHNTLTQLPLSQNTDLTYLDCSLNLLTSLDLFPNDKLVKVFCHSNQLTSFKISKFKNTTLRTIVITNNRLTSLNLKTSTYLDKLWCYNNPSLSSVCVASLAKAQSNPDYKKDAAAVWTTSCGWVPREGDLTGEESAASESISVYPNPAKGLVQVVSSETIDRITIKALNGSQVLLSEQQNSLDIHHLPAGMYLVEIATASGVKTRKLMVE
jgi:hypothetical protein